MVAAGSIDDPADTTSRAGAVRAATPVAVIGMACRLPGGISSPDEFWMALLRGDDLVTEVPRDRWDLDDYYDPEPGVAGRTASKWGAFLDDVAGFAAVVLAAGGEVYGCLAAWALEAEWRVDACDAAQFAVDGVDL